MSKIRFVVLAGPLLFVAGCFPLELDVNDKGEVLIARQEGFFLYNPATRQASGVMGPGGGQPVFARFAPGGKEALLIVRNGQDQFRFEMMPLAGDSKPKTILESKNAAYTLFSPDGAYLAVARITDKERKEDRHSKIPELILIDLVSGSKESLLEDNLVSFRWFADSQRLLLFKAESVNKETNHVTGDLIEFDVKSRKEKRMARAIGDQRMCIELAPDNKTVLFTAYAAGKPGAKLEMLKERLPGQKMYEWKSADAPPRVFSEAAEFARYSPTGKKVLLAKSDFYEGEISVADASGKEPKVLARDVNVRQTGDPTLPGWLNEHTIFYFSNRHVYGNAGKSFTLMTIGADGSNKKNVQPALDKSVLQLAKGLPNYAPPTKAPPVPEQLVPAKIEVPGGFPQPANVPSTNLRAIILAGLVCVLFLLISLFWRVMARRAKNESK